MRLSSACAGVFLAGLCVSSNASAASPDDVRTFSAHGIVEAVRSQTIVIQHEAISNYMDAMTMPFTVKNQNDLAGLKRGDQIAFQLHVTHDTSWVDHFSKTGTAVLPPERTNSVMATHDAKFELLHYRFTNELNQAVSLSDFPGQALAITFFYTRCPLPDYCPRLSKNFAEASQKLDAMANAPTNWHFISISFDPEFDTPERLYNYAQRYQYDPAHWSFLTGPTNKIRELALRSGITIQDDNGILNHNFRTLIINRSGRLQTVFPMTGDLSEMIVDEILKAAAETNTVVAQNR